MRIAYITDAASVHAYKWISFFAQHHQVILICSESQRNPDLYKMNRNIKVYSVLPDAYPLKKIFKRSQTLRKIKKIISDHKIEIIHSMYVVPNSFWALHLDFSRHIITTRGSDVLVDYAIRFHQPHSLADVFNSFFLKRITERALQHAAAITSTSSAQAAIVQKITKHAVPVHVIPTGIETQTITEKLNTLKKQSASFTILSCRALKRMYNIHVMIEAIPILKASRPDLILKLQIVTFNSDPLYLSELKDLIKVNELENEVDFLPSSTLNIDLQYLVNADLLLMLPETDGTPNSALEAMLAQKPMILGKAEYDETIFNDKTVWFCKDHTASALAQSITEVMHESKAIMESKMEEAKNAVKQNADLYSSLKRIEELYKSVLHEI